MGALTFKQLLPWRLHTLDLDKIFLGTEGMKTDTEVPFRKTQEGQEGEVYCWWAYSPDSPICQCERDRKTLSSVLPRGEELSSSLRDRHSSNGLQRGRRPHYTAVSLPPRWICEIAVIILLSSRHLATKPCGPCALAAGWSSLQHSQHRGDTGEQTQRGGKKSRWKVASLLPLPKLHWGWINSFWLAEHTQSRQFSVCKNAEWLFLGMEDEAELQNDMMQWKWIKMISPYRSKASDIYDAIHCYILAMPRLIGCRSWLADGIRKQNKQTKPKNVFFSYFHGDFLTLSWWGLLERNSKVR